MSANKGKHQEKHRNDNAWTLPGRIKGVPMGYASMVQLRAVIFAVVRTPAAVPSQDKLRAVIGKKVQHVWRLWRRHVAELTRLGWPRAGEENFKYRLAPFLCRPSGVILDSNLRMCQHDAICPFCWMRKVFGFWCRMVTALDQLCAAGSYDIVSRAVMTQDIANPIRWYYAETIRRKKDGQAVGQLPKGQWAGMEWSSLRGFADGVWYGESRQVWIVPREYTLPLALDGGMITAERCAATRKDLCRVVAWAARYPSFLLVGPPAVAIEAWKVRQRIRTCSCMGLAHGIVVEPPSKTEQEQEQESIEEVA